MLSKGCQQSPAGSQPFLKAQLSFHMTSRRCSRHHCLRSLDTVEQLDAVPSQLGRTLYDLDSSSLVTWSCVAEQRKSIDKGFDVD